METRQEAARRRQREREEREWFEEELRHRRDDERQARRQGRYVVLINAPSMNDPVPPAWLDIFTWSRFEVCSGVSVSGQADALSSADFNCMIRRTLGIRTGPRSARNNPPRNFDSLTPFILVRRPRYRSLSEIVSEQAGDAEFGWDEQFGPEPAEEEDVEQVQPAEEEVVEQVQPAEEDAEQEQLAAGAENDDEPKPYPYFVDIDMGVFLNLDYDGGWGQEDDVAGQAADGAGSQDAEEDAEQDQLMKQMMRLFLS